MNDDLIRYEGPKEAIDALSQLAQSNGNNFQAAYVTLKQTQPALADQISLTQHNPTQPVTVATPGGSGGLMNVLDIKSLLEQVYAKGRGDAEQDAKIADLERRAAVTETVSKANMAATVNHLQQHQAVLDGSMEDLNPGDSLRVAVEQLEAGGVSLGEIYGSLPQGAQVYLQKSLAGLPVTQEDEAAADEVLTALPANGGRQ